MTNDILESIKNYCKIKLGYQKAVSSFLIAGFVQSARDETFNNEKERVKQYGKRKNYQKRNSHCLEHDAGGNRITNRIWSAKSTGSRRNAVCGKYTGNRGKRIGCSLK